MLNTRSPHAPTGRRRTGTRAGQRVAAALVVGAVALLSGCGTGTGTKTGGDTSTAPTVSPATSPADASLSPTPGAPSRAPGSDGASTSKTPQAKPRATVLGVYFMVDTRTGLRLAREMHDLTGDPATKAVEAMIKGPDDPDYTSPWNTTTRVLGVTHSAGTITVDLSREARAANVGSQGAALMVQQLVYTATEAVSKRAKVQLLVDGRKPGDLWGAVRWDRPVGREDPLDVRSLVQIDAPREAATSSSPVTVAGEAAAYEANVPWRILDAQGAVVKSGATLTTEGQTFAPFSFRVVLPPGLYTVEIREDDPSGGAGGPPMTDSRTFAIQ